jgi:pyruvate dehydrogenase E1 component
VRGNGKIIQELESFFRGAGWNVIKVVWGREWDALLHADRDGALVNLMNTTPDGDYQTYKATTARTCGITSSDATRAPRHSSST